MSYQEDFVLMMKILGIFRFSLIILIFSRIEHRHLFSCQNVYEFYRYLYKTSIKQRHNGLRWWHQGPAKEILATEDT